MHFDNKEEEKTKNDEVVSESKAFEQDYLVHLRESHPEFEPPVDVVRRLLGKDAIAPVGVTAVSVRQGSGESRNSSHSSSSSSSTATLAVRRERNGLHLL